MAAPTNSELQIRKLRKKLRQIENLERLDRDLLEDERLKISQKDYIRETLLQCLDHYNEGPEVVEQPETDTSYGTDWSSFSQPSQSPVPAATSDWRSQNDGERLDDVHAGRVQTAAPLVVQDAKHKHKDPDVTEQGDVTPPKIPRKDKKTKIQTQREMSHRCHSAKRMWTNACFDVTLVEGHEELVTSIDMDEEYLVTASRDTTVKIWDLKTLIEVRSLGGHSLTVTTVCLLSQDASAEIAQYIQSDREDRVVISGSLDCSFKFWSVRTGVVYKSVYTFAPISKLLYLPDTCMVLTGTGGGKIELFDMKLQGEQQEAAQEVNAHEEPVTGLCMCSGYIFSSCEKGDICVFELREDKLHLVWVNEKVHLTNGSQIRNRHTRALAGFDTNIYYGDDGTNIKSLHWKKALVRKIRNHSGVVGVTDSLCINDGLLMSSAYDLDTGFGYINAHWVPEEEYLATLNDEDSDRIICIGCTVSKNELVTIATGGLQLKVWRMALVNERQESADNEGLIHTSFLTELGRNPIDSDIESDAEFSESDDDVMAIARGDNPQRQAGWFSWCSIL